MLRLYYSISDVSKQLDEETYVLRYWEKEFHQISPKKNKAGKRVYSEKDIEIIKAVKKLLRDDKLSIQGAKEQIRQMDFSANKDNKETKNSHKAQAANNLQISFDDENQTVRNKTVIETYKKIKFKLEQLLDKIQEI
ncbi:MAG TPA: MerR family transcriptional regulator [Candidatus Kapabacteria bacterium]|nr:MerR family transcriptional regulator [Candidatus Kapabacteria bacterium]